MATLRKTGAEHLECVANKDDDLVRPARRQQILPYAGPLGQKAAHGFLWLAAQTLSLKLVAILGQLVLAWLLDREDFALIGLAYTVTAFTGLVQQAGLADILVQRQRRYRRWANAAFWMSVATGLAAGLLTVAAAPFAAWFYHSQKLVGLLLVLAASAPIASIGQVPTAQLQIALRFRTLSTLGVLSGASSALLSVIFAVLGAGAYSFVLPRLIVPAAQAISLWCLTRPPLQWSAQTRRWRYLAGDSSVLFAVAALGTITMQGDNIILGKICSKPEFGAYVFAFNLAIQAMILFSTNLSAVLFPALSKLNDDPSRQSAAFLRAARSLAIVGIPLCLLQSGLARPVIPLLYGTKWDAAIPIVQLGGLSVAFGLLNGPAVSLIQAQGRFRTLLKLHVFAAAVFLVFVVPGALIGRTVGAATAGCFASAIVSVVFLKVALRSRGGRLYDVAAVFVPPLLAATVAVGSAWLLGTLVGAVPARLWVQSGLIAFVSGAVYIPLIRLLAPSAWRDLAERLTGLFNPKAGDPSTGPT